jgi:ABC-type transport system involved in cytochrome bd biosynthesis fused ATPase/permease subunit
MDEATSSIDNESDQLIKNVLKSKFPETTLLSVAHRIHTIASFDKIMVLDTGKLIEFSTPHNLLQDETSMFSEYVNASGTISKEIRGIALKHHNSLRKPRLILKRVYFILPIRFDDCL